MISEKTFIDLTEKIKSIFNIKNHSKVFGIDHEKEKILYLYNIFTNKKIVAKNRIKTRKNECKYLTFNL